MITYMQLVMYFPVRMMEIKMHGSEFKLFVSIFQKLEEVII